MQAIPPNQPTTNGHHVRGLLLAAGAKAAHASFPSGKDAINIPIRRSQILSKHLNRGERCTIYRFSRDRNLEATTCDHVLPSDSCVFKQHSNPRWPSWKTASKTPPQLDTTVCAAVKVAHRVGVVVKRNRSYPSPGITPGVRADSFILERCQFCGRKLRHGVVSSLFTYKASTSKQHAPGPPSNLLAGPDVLRHIRTSLVFVSCAFAFPRLTSWKFSLPPFCSPLEHGPVLTQR